MEIKTEDYCVEYDPTLRTVTFAGRLRLAGAEDYAAIAQLLDDTVTQGLPLVVLNLQSLHSLNSSGMAMLSKFVIKVRQHKTIQIIVQGSKDIPWQGRSLKNLQRLMPDLQLKLD
ncbi:MAG: hypothetical protein HC866_08170 [Leptolyngbyaceae cyanobacterium RU_5_1]|nr:hypothetical protein [Leptolyngbyaceae cyanobacterium RU_5_1]